MIFSLFRKTLEKFPKEDKRVELSRSLLNELVLEHERIQFAVNEAIAFLQDTQRIEEDDVFYALQTLRDFQTFPEQEKPEQKEGA